MSEENKAMFRKFVDAMNNKDTSIVVDLLADNYVDHDAPPGFPPGAQGMKDMMEMFFTAFPDLKITINQLVAEGDIVVGAMTSAGTQTRDFMGIPPSGKKMSITEMHMVCVADGKAVEHWGAADSMTMMQQIGAMPSE